MEQMEAKLAAYRSKKQREKMVDSVKSTLKEALSWQRSNSPVDDIDEVESFLSDESNSIAESEEPKCGAYKWILYGLYFLLWVTLYVVAIKVQFGAVYFIVTTLIFIYCNTRTGPKKKDEVSAYSVFNKDCKPIEGTLDAEQLQRQMMFGAVGIH